MSAEIRKQLRDLEGKRDVNVAAAERVMRDLVVLVGFIGSTGKGRNDRLADIDFVEAGRLTRALQNHSIAAQNFRAEYEQLKSEASST